MTAAARENVLPRAARAYLALVLTVALALLLPSLAQQCYIEAEGLGHGAKDLSAVILPMEAIAGVKVSAKPAATG